MSEAHALLDLAERHVVITGGGGHLGRRLVDAFAGSEASIAVIDRTIDDAEVALTAINGDHIALAADLSSQKDMDAAIENIRKHWRGVDVFVHAAAFVGDSDLPGWSVPFEEQTTETFRSALDVNLTSMFHLVRGLAPVLRTSGNGSVISIGSIYGHLGPDWSLYEETMMASPDGYAASKGGLAQLTRWLATSLAPDIRCNMVSPGGIARGQDKQFIERYKQRTPLGRMATEDDVVGAVMFFASDMSRYITGQHLMVDGGWSAW